MSESVKAKATERNYCLIAIDQNGSLSEGQATHLSPLSDHVGTEVLVVDDSTHNSTVLEDAAHGETPDLLEARDPLDDADHGLVVAERVAVDAHEAEVLGELDHQVHAERAQAAATLVFLHHDERVGSEAPPRILADGQDKGRHHLARLLVHDGKLVAVLDVLAELLLVHVLVSAEPLALLGSVHDEEISLVQLRVCHGVHQHVTPVHQGGAEGNHLGRQL